jgi:hypothetical protein
MTGRRLALAAPAIGIALALPAGAGAVTAPPLKPVMVAQVGYGPSPIGFARSANGVLHIAYETNTNWGDSASGVGTVSISPTGAVGPQVQALAWTQVTGGSPNGVPGLAVLPSGDLEATFGGSPSGVEGPWAVTSSDGGATWSVPANVGSGALFAGDSNVGIAVSNGTPVLTAGCCGNIVIQQGLGLNMPTTTLTGSSDDSAGNTNLAVDASTGALITSWDSNAGSGGLWIQQAAPTPGAAEKLPLPAQYGTGTPEALAGRDTGSGVFGAYPADYGATTHLRLLRYGGGSVAVGSVAHLHAVDWGVATGPDGRIWVAWYGQVDGKEITAFTRSDKAVTRFEPIQTYRDDWAQLFSLSGDGRLGPFDLLMSGTPAANKSVAGIYHARVLPELSAAVSATAVSKTKFTVTVTVTDAGDAVSGATVTSKGLTKKTSAKGVAKLTLTGIKGATINLKVTAPTYKVLTQSATL